MKVLIISSCYGTYGGIEAFVIAIAKALLTQENCFPRIVWKKVNGFCLTEQLQSQCEDSAVPYAFVAPRSYGIWKEIQEADIIHAQNSPPDIVIFSAMQKKPLVLTIHNRRMKEHRFKSIVWFYLQSVADRRWYNSKFVQRSWEREKVRKGSGVIPTVSDLPVGEVAINLRRGFCFASRWIDNKGMEHLLQAYEELKLNPNEWPLHMIGDGPLYPSLRDRYEKVLGIIFHGFISELNKASLIKNAKWMVIPPHTQEDFGLTAIEARSVGVPCIATRDGGLPEAAGTSALLCDPNNKESLKQAMSSAVAMTEDEYLKRSQEAKEGLKSFLMTATDYIKLYKSLKK